MVPFLLHLFQLVIRHLLAYDVATVCQAPGYPSPTRYLTYDV